MKITHIEVEATAEELRACGSLSDMIRGLLGKVTRETNDSDDEEDDEE